MLYKKNNTQKLDKELFKNPTSEYRGAPFWAWNCELEEDELLRQIEYLKEMGMGGFHMHTRSGMETTYLSDEFMKLVKSCVKKAKKEDMLAWLYDEDRWPSGAAGGYVTKDPKYRQRNLLFTVNKRDDDLEKDDAIEKGAPYFIGAYDIHLDKNGFMTSYKMLKEGEEATGICRYAYVLAEEPSGWFNGEAYLDTLNPEAVNKFIEITHETYKKEVGEEFGKTIPAMFTDEPHFAKKETLSFAESDADVCLPWTPDFDKTYFDSYGISLTEHLPELFWDLADGKVSKVRYYYHDHVCERFTTAYSDQYGKWCRDNGIYMTGHMWEENTLRRQTAAIGEAMRAYRNYGLPGIDMLCNFREYDTVKQAQSATRQFGYEGVLSELYGVTNWDFDFRGHKFQGDWQAAMGVTARVHHLSWVSMKGAAKRDYPASINYQSPWYKEYSYIEDHFARLGTVLTRGKSKVNVGVIHPVESYWINWGPSENTADVRNQLDKNFADVIEWLLFGTIDFDFISESCLPDLCTDVSDRVTVGQMSYSAIVVPECITLRKTTVDMIDKFIQKGGKVIFMGACPKYIDVEENSDIERIYNSAIRIPFSKNPLLDALCEERDIEIRDEFGEMTDQFFYQMREDNACRWLFVANARPETMNIFLSYNGAERAVNTVIKIKGELDLELYDTLTGDIKEIPYIHKNGFTEIDYAFYANDSLLLRLTKAAGVPAADSRKPVDVFGCIDCKHKVEYTREEENVCVLDLAEYALDGGELQPTEEIFRIDRDLRQDLGWSLADGQDVQPWVIEKEKITHFVTLKFTFNSEEEIEGTYFCAEEVSSLNLNAEEIKLEDCGYFVDKSIRKYAMPKIRKGENILIARVPFGKRISLETCYLIGDFDASVAGCEITLKKPSDKIAFGSITNQGMPFYGGNLTYRMEVEITEDCDVLINSAKYIGALQKVYFDGEEKGNIAFEPYTLMLENVKKGKHILEMKFFGNRNNTFGALHNCGRSTWYGPNYWYSIEDSWCYEYNLKNTGILKSPVLKMLKRR